MEAIQNFNEILKSFNIKAFCTNYQKIDNYSYFDLRLSPNTKVKDLQKYSDEISLLLKTPCKPSVKILHSQGLVRLEFITLRKHVLNLFEYFTNDQVPTGELICLLGKTVDDQRVWMDLIQNPHMIISGTTGSGKSTLLNNIIANVLNYNQAALFLMDPKHIEFSEYEIHFKDDIQVSYSYNECVYMLDTLIDVMEQRYNLLRQNLLYKDINPILIIIDEFADLIIQDTDNSFYSKLCQLSQKCRAAKMSIILSTQRPSVDIVNGIIKANFPARISCRVVSHVDSRVILDSVGAEKLLGNGDALLRDNFRYLERFQIAYTTSTEVCKYFGV